MFNSEFNKFLSAYNSIICQQKQNVFDQQQVEKIIQLLKNNKKSPLKFFKIFKKQVIKNDYKGHQFSMSDWNEKIKPILDQYCKLSGAPGKIWTKKRDTIKDILEVDVIYAQNTSSNNQQDSSNQSSQQQIIDQKAITQYANEIGKYVKYLQQHKDDTDNQKVAKACQQFEKITKDYFKTLTISPDIAKRIFQMGENTMWDDKDQCKKMLSQWEIKVDQSVAKKQKGLLNKLSFGLFS